MAALLYVAFLWPYTLATAHFANLLRWNDTTPDYFLPLLLFVLASGTGRAGLVLAALTGVASDVAAAHVWAMDGTCYALLFLLLRKPSRVMSWASPLVYLPGVLVVSYLLAAVTAFLDAGPASLPEAHRRALLTLVLTAPLFQLFRMLRLFWGVRTEPGHGFTRER